MGYLRRLLSIEPPTDDRYNQSGGAFVAPGMVDGVDPSIPLALGIPGSGPPAPISTVAAIIAVISQTCGQLPREILSSEDRSRQVVLDDRYRYLIFSPNDNDAMSGNTFWEAMFASKEGWGNAFAWIDRYSKTWRGVQGLYFLMPQRVEPYRDGLNVRYRIEGDSGRSRGKGEVLHIAKNMYDGIQGMSPMRSGAITHELTQTAEKQGLSFLRSGATMGGVVESADEMTKEQIDRFYERAAKFHSGADRAGNIMLLLGNKKYQSVGIPPNEAQFLETRTFQREEILGWYAPGMPHHLLGWKSSASNWGTGVEAQSIAFVKYVLLSRLSRVEEAIGENFLPPHLRFEFSVDGLLRGDSKARTEVHKAMRQWSVLSADEWRARESMPLRGIPDDYLHPLNMERISKETGKVLKEEVPAVEQAPMAPAAAMHLLDELRCGNDKCKSRVGGKRGALLGTEVGAVKIRCHQCGETTTVKPSDTLRDDRDLSDALDKELARRMRA